MLFNKLILTISLFTFTLGQVAFALPQDKESIENLTSAIASQFDSLKANGAQIKDEQGQEISINLIIFGGKTTFSYFPEATSIEHKRGIHFFYKGNPKEQTVTIAALSGKNVRLGARKFRLDPSKTPQQNAIAIKQTLNSLYEEMDQYFALKSNKNSHAPSRLPASYDPSPAGVWLLLVGVIGALAANLCITVGYAPNGRRIPIIISCSIALGSLFYFLKIMSELH